jgi:thiamine biosynthesis protein ThiI
VINSVLVIFGEIYIRGKNRKKFFDGLINIILDRLKNARDFIFVKEQGRFVIEKSGEAFESDQIIKELLAVSGINKLCPAIKLDNFDLEEIKNVSLLFLKKYKIFNKNQNKTFKIITKRANKNWPVRSREVTVAVADFILDNSDLKVDVIDPDITLKIEMRKSIYIYEQEIKGVGGLPYGVSGKAVLALSGGIDSPVAGYLTAARGVELEAVYFHSPPFVSEAALQKVRDICAVLARFFKPVKLRIVNFTETQLYINQKVDKNKTTIFLKRGMLIAAEKIALASGAKALVVGDSVGQVASQTQNSIYVIDSAVEVPILRPLAAMNKDDIVSLSKKIGTYDISIRPYDDACVIFVPESPDLSPSKKVVDLTAKRLTRLTELIDKAVEESIAEEYC